MNKKYLIFGLTLIALLLPMMAFGQNPPASNMDYNKLLQFLKGDGAFEKWFMQVFTRLDTRIYAEASNAKLLGQALGGFGALMYLGYLGFQMQEGARPWEVTPMIKPIIIGLILANWTSFTNLIYEPFRYLSQPSENTFTEIENEVNNVRIARFKMQNQILDALVKKRAQEQAQQDAIEQAAANTDSSIVGDLLGSGMEDLTAPIREWFLRIDFQWQRLFAECIEAVGLTVLRVCTYFIFFIQKIWIYVLIVLGPIAAGMSLIPGFDNSLYNWIAKFINICLYNFVAYTIINIGQQLIITGYEMEIDRYKLMIDSNGVVVDMTMLETYVANYGMLYTVLFPIVSYLVTGIGVLMTPSIADAVVSASGAHIMGKAKSSAGTIAGGAKAIGGAAAGAATGGAATAATIAKGVTSAIKNIKK